MPCPVPPEQRPLQEYEQLLASWFGVMKFDEQGTFDPEGRVLASADPWARRG